MNSRRGRIRRESIVANRHIKRLLHNNRQQPRTLRYRLYQKVDLPLNSPRERRIRRLGVQPVVVHRTRAGKAAAGEALAGQLPKQIEGGFEAAADVVGERKRQKIECRLVDVREVVDLQLGGQRGGRKDNPRGDRQEDVAELKEARREERDGRRGDRRNEVGEVVRKNQSKAEERPVGQLEDPRIVRAAEEADGGRKVDKKRGIAD